MKKILTLALVFMMVISLFVSCNDGEEGLFQMAANSVRKESFKILNIVNKESENVYIVATDNGIAKYDIEAKRFSDFKGNGVMATNVIWASSDGSQFVYYDTTDHSYKDQDGKVKAIANLEDKMPQPFYSVNGNEITYVFKDTKGNFHSFYTSTPLSSIDSLNPTLISIEGKTIASVSIIGNGILRVITSDKKAYFYDAEHNTSHNTNLVVQGIADDGLFITNDGKIYNYDEIDSETKTTEIGTKHTINKRPAMFSVTDGVNNYSYFIPEGSSNIFEIKRDGDKATISTKTVTGLQNITVIAILEKKDTNKLLVLTANNGVQELEMK